jgi:hypothetical protein
MGCLTFLIPGLGQRIIGKGKKRVAMFIGAIILGAISVGILYLPFMFWSYYDYYYTTKSI